MPTRFPSSVRISYKFTGPAVLILLVVAILGICLFSGGTLLPALPSTDLHKQFLGWRYFGFTQWMAGHFPFWNPHVFCGIPFSAQFQSNLLYPITWVNFLVNVATGTVIEMAANVITAALCTYFWARLRGISRAGATLAGAAFAFSGPVYLRVLAGHLSPLASLAWIPLVFAALDLLLEEKFLAALLLGAAAVALQWLGGYPQYCYYGFLVAALYLFLQSLGHRHVFRMYLGFAGIYLLGGMIAAVQIIPAYFAAQLSIRGGAGSYFFASMFSFPPENLLTILLPYPLGDTVHHAYAGRWYLWEMSVYIGIINLALAMIAIAFMARGRRWRTLALLIAVMVLMLGSFTPVHVLLYRYLPGFALFRGPSKFGAMWALLLAILAGEGFDIARQRALPRIAVWIGLASAFCIFAGVFFLTFSSGLRVEKLLLTHIYRTGQFFYEQLFHQRHLVAIMADWIAYQWLLAGALLIITAALLYLRRWVNWVPYLLMVLAIAEIYLAAWDSSVTAPVRMPYPPEWITAVQTAIAADQRVAFADNGYNNSGNVLGEDTLWGYDPAQPKRYTELMAAANHEPSDIRVPYTPPFEQNSRVFQLLRCRYIIPADPNAQVMELPDPMPHLQLIGRCVRMNDPAAMVSALAGNFNFRSAAILESDPNPPPDPAGARGRVTLLGQTINDLEIQADLPAPALLLITDAYAPGWHVRPLENNPNQAKYDVLCADDVLRAIPLAAGHHHFDLFYTPPGLKAGISISALALIAMLAGTLALLKSAGACTK